MKRSRINRELQLAKKTMKMVPAPEKESTKVKRVLEQVLYHQRKKVDDEDNPL